MSKNMKKMPFDLFMVVLVLFGLSSCQILRPKKGLKKMAQMTFVRGQVIGGSKMKSPIYVVLYENAAEEPLKYHVLNKLGEVDFYLPLGTYRVFGFQDLNHDRIYQSGEPAQFISELIIKPENISHPGVSFTMHFSARASLPAPQVDLSQSGISANLELHLKNRGLVLPLDDFRFAPENGTMGFWEPMRFVEEVGAGIYLQGPFDQNKIPMLFIHGANGTPRDFATLVTHLDTRQIQPWFFYYPTGMPLTVIARYLSFSMQDLKTQYGYKELMVVAHSMGGLVAYAFIQDFEAMQPIPVTRGYFSLSTPWGGMPAAETGVAKSPTVVPSWHDLSPQSALLKEIYRDPLPPYVPHELLFGFKRTSGAIKTLLADNHDGAVIMRSVLAQPMQGRAACVRGFDDSHVEILNDPAVAQEINRFVTNLP